MDRLGEKASRPATSITPSPPPLAEGTLRRVDRKHGTEENHIKEVPSAPRTVARRSRSSTACVLLFELAYRLFSATISIQQSLFPCSARPWHRITAPCPSDINKIYLISSSSGQCRRNPGTTPAIFLRVIC